MIESSSPLIIALVFGVSCSLCVQIVQGVDRQYVIWGYIAASVLVVHLYLPSLVLLVAQAVLAAVLIRMTWFDIKAPFSRWLEVQVIFWVVLLPTMYIREPTSAVYVFENGWRLGLASIVRNYLGWP